MYNGYWSTDKNYKRGDVIYVCTLSEYYICINDHISDRVTFPNKEDIYWMYISNNFLDFLKTADKIDNISEPMYNKKEKQLDIKDSLNDIRKRKPKPPIYLKRSSSYTQESNKRNELKRKLRMAEDEIINYKRQKTYGDDLMDSLKNKLLCMDLNIETKSFLLDKYESIKGSSSSSDNAKALNWLNTIVKIPYGKCKDMDVKSSDSSDKLKMFFKKVKDKLDENIYGLENVKDEILEFVARKITNPNSKGHVLALYGNGGVGKCHGYDTPILMFDGSIKMVQDIKVGEQLMGDDSTPRQVLSLARGQEEMFKIEHTLHDESYIVNKSHILTLKISYNKKLVDRTDRNSYVVKWFDTSSIKFFSKSFNYSGFRNGNTNKNYAYKEAKEFFNSLNDNKIIDISVKDYLKLNKRIRKNLQGFKVGVEFHKKELDFDPYIIGLWLGDGASNSTQISNQDSTILHYLSHTLPKYKCHLQYYNKYDYGIIGTGRKNTFLNVLRNNKLLNNKHIPDLYKINSRENRLKLLAGIIDSDGYYIHNTYEISQKNNKLAHDIVYLCRSLGFQCKLKKIEKGCWYKNEYKKGEYNKIAIYGNNLEDIPTLCLRKKGKPRKQIKDPLVTAINITSIGQGNYYGFELDGNHRYLLGNFIVTHNTMIIKSLAEALDLPFYQINFGGLNDVSVLTGHSETYIGSKPGKLVEILTCSNYMNPIIYLDEIDKVSESRATEIYGILTHLLDEEQNAEFEDNYLSNIKIDLSKVFFVIAFNDISKVDSILLNRLKVIYIDPPNIEDKVIICQTKLIPNILKTIKLKKGFNIILERELIEYIISCKTQDDKGVRQLKKNIEKIFNRLNYDILIDNLDLIKKEKVNDSQDITLIITKTYIDKIIKSSNNDKSYLQMYN